METQFNRTQKPVDIKKFLNKTLDFKMLPFKEELHQSEINPSIDQAVLMHTLKHSQQDANENRPITYVQNTSNKSTPNKYSYKKQRFKDI